MSKKTSIVLAVTLGSYGKYRVVVDPDDIGCIYAECKNEDALGNPVWMPLDGALATKVLAKALWELAVDA